MEGPQEERGEATAEEMKMMNRLRKSQYQTKRKKMWFKIAAVRRQRSHLLCVGADALDEIRLGLTQSLHEFIEGRL